MSKQKVSHKSALKEKPFSNMSTRTKRAPSKAPTNEARIPDATISGKTYETM